MTYSEAFGAVFRRLRLQRGLTQEDFQIAASDRYIRNLEKGKQSPTLEMVSEICSVLDINPVTLVSLVQAEFTGEEASSTIKRAVLELSSLDQE
ncbi:helix-turn-helix domain-containing protein [Pseudomonas sp. NPDC089547]|uniref:helix-turn-helix domain-containing protein n=1 Tax=Pseudomonas sp. NPDC089547 TaxID=3390652 RepID=UPI003D0068A9